jgi:predicted nicotinamide N-methyase
VRPQKLGKTVLDLASAKGHAAVADRLRAAQAAQP